MQNKKILCDCCGAEYLVLQIEPTGRDKYLYTHPYCEMCGSMLTSTKNSFPPYYKVIFEMGELKEFLLKQLENNEKGSQ